MYGVIGGQSVVGKGQLGLEKVVDGGSGGGTGGGGGGNRWGGGGDELNWWEDTVANVILGTEPNTPLAYAPVLELRHPIMSMLEGHRAQLERKRERYYTLNTI